VHELLLFNSKQTIVFAILWWAQVPFWCDNNDVWFE